MSAGTGPNGSVALHASRGDGQIHRDFLLVERDQALPDDGAADMRPALRAAWPLPTDTFVTADLPALLTILSVRRD